MSTTTNTIVIAQQKVDLEASYRALIDGLNTLYPEVHRVLDERRARAARRGRQGRTVWRVTFGGGS